MNLPTRLLALERVQAQWCPVCRGRALPDLTDLSRSFTDEEKIALYRRAGREDLMPQRLKELAQRQEPAPGR
jgi:hypothetical protein